jgi:pimeloyl-ACP methyl ester carboxylesterase
MEKFTSFDGGDIAYLDVGQGPTVFLLHGFAADHHLNWVAPGVVDALVASGRRVIAADARGHGASTKPHQVEAYTGDAMVKDAQSLMDHLGVEQVDVVGYSMGSLVSSRLVPRERRARSLVLGGVGGDLGRQPERLNRAAIAAALEVEVRSTIEDASARAFRAFADSTGADRLALAAVLRGAMGQPAALGEIAVPTLVVAGDKDVLAGSPQALADRIPGAIANVISGDHLGAVNDPEFARCMVSFLASVPG